MFDRKVRLESLAGIAHGSYLAALALWSLLVAAAVVPAEGLAATAVDAASARRLQAIIDHSRDDGLPGGIIVRMESLKDGRIWTGTSGPFDEATAQPIKPTAAFRIASITKSFTAAVIWRLAEDGKISVDDTIAKYLPAELVGRIHVLNGVSYGDRITIRQLLCHCAGVYDYATDKNVLRYTFAHPKKHWTPMELVNTALRSGAPYFPPGQGQHYSDTGYLLLGMIIEKVTAKPLARVYHEFIYSPLGMHDIYLEAREPAVGPPLSHNYVGYLDEHDFDPTLDAYASGGQVTTAAELARFITAVMQGHFFKDPKTLEAALAKPEIPGKPAVDEERYLGRYLFYSTERDGVAWMGHSGFWGAAMFYDAQRDIVITGTSNQVDRRLPLAELLKAFENASVSR